MSEKYEDFDYETEETNSNSGLTKKILIILLVIIAIVLVLYLVKGCSKKDEEVIVEPVSSEYEDALIEAAKKYYDEFTEELPTTAGECSQVTLSTLTEKKLIDSTKFATCETSKTYIRVCMLTDGKRQYTPWLTCTDRNSENEYGELVEGTIDDVITNVTYVEFKFLPQVLKVSNYTLGSVEEMWKSDIKYSSYKTLSTTNYYRYRDKLFTWNLNVNKYYSSTGDVDSEDSAKEYYTSAPSSEYNNSTAGTTAYKWYKEEYKLGANGSKDAFDSCPSDYPNVGKLIDTMVYRTADESTKTSPNKFYICSTTEKMEDSKYLIYTPYECDKRPVSDESKETYKYQVGFIYSCAATDSASDTILGNKVGSSSDYCYTKWNKPTLTACDTTKSNCQSIKYKFKQCYKKVYIKNAKGNDVYYTAAPSSDAIKDTSSATTAYKWYKKVTTTTTEYTAVAPSGNYSSTEKTSNYKWSNWSDWSKDKNNASDGRTRTFETKAKIKLQRIYLSGDEEWTNLNENYVTLQEMLEIFNTNKYEVSSLADINNNGEIRYKLKMYIRNKKEKGIN